MRQNLRQRMKWWLEYAIIWPFVKLLQKLPQPIAFTLGRFIGRIAYWVSRGDRRWCDINLQLVYGENLTPAQRSRLAKAVYDHHARTVVEILRIDKQWTTTRCHCEGYQHVLDWIAKNPGRGMIAVTGHLGNFEIIGPVANRVGLPGAIISRPLDNPWFERILARCRQRYGLESHSKSTPSLRDAIRQIRRGEAIGIAIDQNCVAAPVYIDFMGVPAATARGAAILALRENAGVFVVYTYRCPDGSHRVVFTPEIPVVRTGDFEHDIAVNMQRFSKELETRILQHPEQYHWQHPRWRSRPDGSRWSNEDPIETILAVRKRPPLKPPALFRVEWQSLSEARAA